MTERGVVRPWPRLMSAVDASAYLSISANTLKTLGIRVRRIGARVLYDIADLDRWVDQNDEMPLAGIDAARAAEDEERRFFERRSARGAH
jgi:hypothetical protein